MNKERMGKLIEFIEAEEVGFNMRHWWVSDGCDTVACIGGSCEEVMQREKSGQAVRYSAMEVADWLGLDWEFANYLFHSPMAILAVGKKRDRALTVLRALYADMLEPSRNDLDGLFINRGWVKFDDK